MLQPLPETSRAFDEYVEWSEPDLGQVLADLAIEVEGVVPETVALSLTLSNDELTFTLAARDIAAAAPGAIQHLDAEAWPAFSQPDEVLPLSAEGLLDEERWLLFAQAAATAGIRSTLSLPVRDRGRLIGEVNLYASTTRAFDELHEEVATLVGARGEDAVRNADLSFSSRTRAVETPGRLRDLQLVDTAVGILMAFFGEDEDQARRRLARAAGHGGVPTPALARALVDLHRDQH